jgi:hypothetical protein
MELFVTGVYRMHIGISYRPKNGTGFVVEVKGVIYIYIINKYNNIYIYSTVLIFGHAVA